MISSTITGDRATALAFARYARLVGDMSRPLEEAADAGRVAAVDRAPVLTGRLVDSIVVRSSREEATLTAGEGLDYAGVQNFGWPARGIAASQFMDAAEEVVDREAADDVSGELERLARVVGLRVATH